MEQPDLTDATTSAVSGSGLRSLELARRWHAVKRPGPTALFHLPWRRELHIELPLHTRRDRVGGEHLGGYKSRASAATFVLRPGWRLFGVD